MTQARSRPGQHLRLVSWLLGAWATHGACSPQRPTELPQRAPAPAKAPREAQPPRLPSPEAFQHPRTRDATAENGLHISVLPRPGSTLVDLRLTVMSGAASDGPRPGSAMLAMQLLKESGSRLFPQQQLNERLLTLGTELEVQTGLDASTLRLVVEPASLDQALHLLSDLIQHPELDSADFEALRHRQRQIAEHAARGSAPWVLERALFAELFSLETKPHPYARPVASSDEIRALSFADCKRWLERHLSPRHSVLQIVGPVTPVAAHKSVQRAFAGWKGDTVSAPIFFQPEMPSPRRILVVDRPGSAQSQLRVALLGPARRSPEFPALSVAARVLGAVSSGRLPARLEGSLGIAHEVNARVVDTAYGPSPFVLSASSRTSATEEALRIMLEELRRLTSEPVSHQELADAVGYLKHSAPLAQHTTESSADFFQQLSILSVPAGYLRNRDAHLSALTPLQVQTLASQHLTAESTLMVVAGDAERIAEPLRVHAQVQVFDPEDGFRLKRVLTHREASR